MSLKKIFIYFSLIPSALGFLNYSLSTYQTFRWGYYHLNQISLAALTIAGLNCLYIIFRNYRTKQNSPVWYVFASIMAILFLGYMYLGLSLQNAGF